MFNKSILVLIVILYQHGDLYWASFVFHFWSASDKAEKMKLMEMVFSFYFTAHIQTECNYVEYSTIDTVYGIQYRDWQRTGILKTSALG